MSNLFLYVIHPRCFRCMQISSKDSQLKTQLVLWIFILFKVTTCFGLYHQAIIRHLQVLHFYNFILVADTTVQNNDNKISLHFKPMRLIFMNYTVQLSQDLLFTGDLMMAW
jgi:hypothetical protein